MHGNLQYQEKFSFSAKNLHTLTIFSVSYSLMCTGGKRTFCASNKMLNFVRFYGNDAIILGKVSLSHSTTLHLCCPIDRRNKSTREPRCRPRNKAILPNKSLVIHVFVYVSEFLYDPLKAKGCATLVFLFCWLTLKKYKRYQITK